MSVPSAELPLLPLALSQVPDPLASALAQEGIATCDYVPGQAATRFVLFDSRVAAPPELRGRQVPIDVHELRRAFDRDPFALLSDERTERAWWRIGPWPVGEEVAAVDRRIVRERLMAALQLRVEAAGGVWLRLAPFPHPYRSAFNLRLDHDDYVPVDFEALLSAVAGHESACSHYVCASGFASRPRALARLRGQHVGSHGYHHHTYPLAADNERNLRRGIDFLRGAGHEPVGFVAPMGRFYRGLLAALRSLGVSHSSEFGLAYDDWPFLVGASSVLQIPVHPICLGICLEAATKACGHEPRVLAHAAEALTEHFCQLVATRHAAGEPAFLYGHPDGRLGRYPDVLRRLFATVDHTPGMWQTTLATFESWWRERLSVRWSVTRSESRLTIEVDRPTARFPLAVEIACGNRWARLPLDKSRVELVPTRLTYERRAPRVEPERIRHSEPTPWRARVLRSLDWETETPLGELSARNWRGWLKRELRRLRGTRHANRQAA